MALEFARTFGNKNNTNTQENKRPPAEFWLNVGYTVEVTMEDGTTEDRFISLSLGIPLDQLEVLPMGRNEGYNQIQAARNDLKEQLMAHARSLKPGDEEVLALEVQLRRVNAPATAPKSEENPYARRLEFVAR